MYNTVFLFDTSVTTGNLGDFIIMDAVKKQLRQMFPNSFFVSTSTHDTIGKNSKAIQKKAEYSFIGGTNLLTDRFLGRNHAQWHIGVRDYSVEGSVGIGLGWQSYGRKNRLIDLPLKVAQKEIYKHALSSRFLHSVRDSYTQKRLQDMGIESINTACVTMWELTPDHLNRIPKGKADTVVTTVTEYCQTPEYMKVYERLMTDLIKNYSRVKLWIQSPGDIEIFQKLNLGNSSKVEFIAPNLQSYDDALDDSVDYIGTRLHAGIRALQHGRRTLIIEMDNRAREIAKDTNLPTISYRQIDKVQEFINSDQEMDIRIPFSQISKWKHQFV
ncbi:polysaccharide pyruvyl transferase family protein [Lactiplantibacillus dongliensis]|uniref:Polysaccharide pyruvyl transferase family protein n=1 Tax=Lactiplantibacillus dongliensis TaxID=2559919 RepID=A0ABW1R3K4_9LACO|nr:polysaccharide pyruvyl transferase family protein [Lactiplantibacillus dongliensis]